VSFLDAEAVIRGLDFLEESGCHDRASRRRSLRRSSSGCAATDASRRCADVYRLYGPHDRYDCGGTVTFNVLERAWRGRCRMISSRIAHVRRRVGARWMLLQSRRVGKRRSGSSPTARWRASARRGRSWMEPGAVRAAMRACGGAHAIGALPASVGIGVERAGSGRLVDAINFNGVRTYKQVVQLVGLTKESDPSGSDQRGLTPWSLERTP
jgi:hypothetical protein